MKTYLVLILISFIFSYLIGNRYKLFDYPSSRKIHNFPVLNIGGMGIILSLIFSIYLFDYSFNFNQIILFSFYFSFLGFIDDRLSINPIYRILIQAIIAGYFLRITNLYISQISITDSFVIQLGSFSEIFTIMCILIIINACNYFDGIDLNLSLIAIVFILLFYQVFKIIDFEKLIILCLPIIVFSFANIGFYKIPKMFLGDSGSNCIGFFIASCLLLYNFEQNETLISQHEIIWVTGLLIYEFLSTNLSRSVRKKNIFEAGGDHLHYIINKLIKNKYLTVLFIIILLIMILFLGKFILLFNTNLSFIFYIIFFFIYFFLREKFLKIKT